LITDTSDEKLAFSHLLMGMTNPNGWVEELESQGQRELVASDMVPTKCSDDEALERMGFVFAKADTTDPLFRHATLPDGWKKIADDNSATWSYIVNDVGIRRVAMYYKAAPYDRRSSMHLIKKLET